MTTDADARKARTEGSADTVLFSVMANRMDGICREMANTLMRTARSSVLALAHDFSCSLVTADGELIAAADGLPVHVIGAEIVARAMTKLHPDVKEGDAFLHNDQYNGNTHAGDHTLLVPVFDDDVHVFTTVVRGHQADIGNALPTSYMPHAKDIYEEGALIFPCVRVQQGYDDVQDIIRMAFAGIRSPEVWYGDYLAMIGAARVGERALKGLCLKYGSETVHDFAQFWLDYAERRMTRAIRGLRPGRWVGTTAHDSVGIVPELPLRVTIDVDVEDGRIEIDLRDNPDCVPAGINTTETTAISTALIGLFNCLDPSVPKNSGAFRRVSVLLRENCVAGIPRFPACCSIATTAVADRIVNMMQTAIAEMGDGYGLAEGAVGLGPDRPNVAGTDARADGRQYAVQLFIGTQGGPANANVDGWLAFVLPVAGGVLHKASIEATEHKVPLVIYENRIRTDAEGPGRFKGAPGSALVYGPLADRVEIFYVLDGVANPPKGVLGGWNGIGPSVFKLRPDGSIDDETGNAGHIVLEPGERLRVLSCGGAGYGDPCDRDPQLLLKDLVDGYLTTVRASEIYGIVVDGDAAKPESLVINQEATTERRSSLRQQRLQSP
jgi:N-methylhydantoinase B